MNWRLSFPRIFEGAVPVTDIVCHYCALVMFICTTHFHHPYSLNSCFVKHPGSNMNRRIHTGFSIKTIVEWWYTKHLHYDKSYTDLFGPFTTTPISFFTALVTESCREPLFQRNISFLPPANVGERTHIDFSMKTTEPWYDSRVILHIFYMMEELKKSSFWGHS